MKTSHQNIAIITDGSREMRVIEAVNRIVNTADNKQWQDCIACFTETVKVDHSSKKGNGEITIHRQDLVEGWIDASSL